MSEPKIAQRKRCLTTHVKCYEACHCIHDNPAEILLISLPLATLLLDFFSMLLLLCKGGQFPCTDNCQVTFVNLKCDSSKKKRRGRKSPSKEVSHITAEFEVEMKSEEVTGLWKICLWREIRIQFLSVLESLWCYLIMLPHKPFSTSLIRQPFQTQSFRDLIERNEVWN